MPYPEPPQMIVNNQLYGVHPHILDGSSGNLIDYGSFIVNQAGIEYTFDQQDGINQYDSFYVYAWHMEVNSSGFSWIRFYYGDNDYDEFRHRGNTTRQFWLKKKNEWSSSLGRIDATGYLKKMDIDRQYIFRGIRIQGTSTWEFANLEPGLTKIVFMNNIFENPWEGMKGIYILNYRNLVRPILENPDYLNEYVYRQNGGTVDQSNQIPAWSNAIQNTKTIVRNTPQFSNGPDFI